MVNTKYIYVNSRYLLHSERFFFNSDISVSSIMNRIYLCMACMLFLFTDIDIYSWFTMLAWSNMNNYIISFDIFYIIFFFYLFFSIYLHIVHTTFKLSIPYIFSIYKGCLLNSNIYLVGCTHYLSGIKTIYRVKNIILIIIYIGLLYYFGLIFVDYLQYNVLEKFYVSMNVRSLFSGYRVYEYIICQYFENAAGYSYHSGNLFLSIVDLSTNIKIINMLYDISMYQCCIYNMVIFGLFFFLNFYTIYSKNLRLLSINKLFIIYNYMIYFIYFLYIKFWILWIIILLIIIFINIPHYFLNIYYYILHYVYLDGLLNLFINSVLFRIILIFKYASYIYYSLFGNIILDDDIMWGMMDVSKVKVSNMAYVTNHHMYYEFSDVTSFYSDIYRNEIISIYYLLWSCVNISILFIYDCIEIFSFIFNIDKLISCGYIWCGIVDIVRLSIKVDPLVFFNSLELYKFFDGEHVWVLNNNSDVESIISMYSLSPLFIGYFKNNNLVKHIKKALMFLFYKD